MNGEILESCSTQRDLGVLISDNCLPASQCAAAAKKANQVLGRINRSFSCKTKDIMLQIYKVFVRPHLEYAVTAWSPCSIYQKRVSGNPRVFAVGSCCVYKINANEQEQSRIFIWKFYAQIKIWRRFCWWYFHLNPTNWCLTGKAYCDTNYVKNGGISSATSHFACEIHNFSCQLLWEIVHDSYSDFSEHNK